MRVEAFGALRGGRPMRLDHAGVSDETRAFTLSNVAPGKVSLMGMPRNIRSSEHAPFTIERTVTGGGTVSLGDITVVRRRLKPGERAGTLGITFVKPAGPPADQLGPELEIEAIDPRGPAAGSALQVGDVIIRCDGLDVTEDPMRFGALTQAPAGTRLALGTRRGPTATIVLAPATQPRGE